MSTLVSSNYGVSSVNTKKAATTPKNISYRGDSDLERTPDNDSFDGENKNKTGKVIGIIAAVLAAAALIVGGVCLHKGGKALGEEAKFGEKIKKGWEELWHKGEKSLKDETKNVTDNAGDAAGKNGNNAEAVLEKKANESVEIGDNVNQGPDGKDLYAQINEVQPLTEAEKAAKEAEEQAAKERIEKGYLLPAPSGKSCTYSIPQPTIDEPNLMNSFREQPQYKQNIDYVKRQCNET